MQDNNFSNTYEHSALIGDEEPITTQEENGSEHNNQEKIATPTKKVAQSLDELTFVRLIDPIHIPSYLVEQMKDRSYEVDTFYDYQKICCLMNTANGPQLNPASLLYAIVHGRLRQVKGFVWFTIDFLTNSLMINAFSMDKEFWNKGEATILLEQKAKKVMRDLSLKRIMWITKTPKLCETKGFKRSKDIIMVYEE